MLAQWLALRFESTTQVRVNVNSCLSVGIKRVSGFTHLDILDGCMDLFLHICIHLHVVTNEF